ncbi:ABC transporter ATP-binding protein [Salinibacter altiplanensis]|uniref:ABC transporter ATP-binding protein n=1 Tax=Salinibacter altiplanensis TaxID=1803181 RepID=UPI001E33E6BE|nr:ABC transporter ATP-binding protein [Salinibacter altiplanensis]
MKTIKILINLLTTRERRKLYLLFCAVVVMAGLEVVSVASIMPFLSVATDPSSVHENTYLRWVYKTVGFTDTNTFLIALGFGALMALIVSNVFIILTTWAVYRYVWTFNRNLSRRLLSSYLYQPYEFFLSRNSAELGKNILDDVREVANRMLRPAMQGGAKAIAALAIIAFLFFVDPVVALMIATILGVGYAAMYRVVRDRLDRAGSGRVEANAKRYQFIDEAFGGIKEVKIRGKEESFLERYDRPTKWYARVQSKYEIIKKAPRYILEAIAFGGIILIAIYLILVKDDFRQVIPILGLYAFAGYRMMPALQKAFRGLASARFNSAALKKISDGFQQRVEGRNYSSLNGESESINQSLSLDEELVMEGVTFSYPGADSPAINDLFLEVPACSTVGFVGKTGSGKTTAVDLILGLLCPQEGTISVDGMPLRGKNIPRWQRDIGYVPQQMYLSDNTVAQNIAFGVPEDEIDMNAVVRAARRAQIHDFITEELLKGWKTIVGERGVKLSGGQQQRIGIARALYHRPSVLVFDEATSALDQDTEASVMEAIYELEDDHTMIMIAHRLSTVKRADSIIMLEKGRKVGEGKYNELAENHSKFQSMAFS